MSRLLSIIRREPLPILAKELVWRAHKRWKHLRFKARVSELDCPVQFCPVGYFRPEIQKESENHLPLLKYCDLVCNGVFSFLGYAFSDIGFPPPWDMDFVSGKRWPSAPGAELVIAMQDGSDVKIPWELSRLQFLPVLGKAWKSTKYDRYANAARTLLADWIDKNPVGIGVNWAVAMEAALRGISICLASELFWPLWKNDGEWLQKITRSLWEHVLFIEAHNEFSHFCRSNHYLSNIIGLFCLSSYLTGPGMQPRVERYRGMIEAEILHQVYADGGDYEASIGYHVLVAQMFCTALLLMRSQRLQTSPEFESRLKRMFCLLAALADSRGRVPQIGDCDDGRVELLHDDLEQLLLPSEQRCSLTIKDLLGIGEKVFGEHYAGRDRAAAWYSPTQSEAAPVPQKFNSAGADYFPNAGVAVCRIQDAEVIFAALPNAIGGKGSHTHNDKLSVVLRLGGTELLSDSGTAYYTRDPECRNYFRSTKAHNTVQVDGEEQNRFSQARQDLFRMHNDASVVMGEPAGEPVVLTGAHTGYCRIGVRHKRTVLLEAQYLSIEDKLEGEGEHSFEAFFHLSCDWQTASLTESGEEVWCDIRGPRKVKMYWWASVPLCLRSFPAQISRAYGVVQSGTALSVAGRAFLPFLLNTRIQWVGVA